MAYEGVLEDVRAAIRLEKPTRLPVFACSEEFDVKWFGKYPYEELCQDGSKIAEAWIAAIEDFDYDWAWVQVGRLFRIRTAWCRFALERATFSRATKDYLPATRETLDSLRPVDPVKDGRIPEKLKAIRLIKEHFGDTRTYRRIVRGSV